ncbi:hypothetical protein [Streptomyces sp. NPDC002758]
MTDPQRFRLTLTAAGRPVMHGWWGSEATARHKFTRWIGEHGSSGARIVLVDTETGETLATWPGVVGGAP